MSRKDARVQAFQTLFQLEIKETDLTIQEAIEFIKDDHSDLDFDSIYWLATGVKDHRIVLDETIRSRLRDWSIGHLLKSDRTILRTAILETLHNDIPKKAVVNEAVEFIKQLNDDDHYKFVNGILSNIND